MYLGMFPFQKHSCQKGRVVLFPNAFAAVSRPVSLARLPGPAHVTTSAHDEFQHLSFQSETISHVSHLFPVIPKLPFCSAKQCGQATVI